jgi:hypothetical protein
MGKRSNISDEERSGRPFIVQSERQLFTISELSSEFPQIRLLSFTPVYLSEELDATTEVQIEGVKTWLTQAY